MIQIDRVDPELRAALSALEAVDPDQDLAEARRAHAQRVAPAGRQEGLQTLVSDRHVAGHSIRVRLYSPGAGARGALPALLWMHGGGFRIGAPEMDEAFCRRVAAEAPCIVASVDYRLSPEHPFPAALHDCYAALRWLAGGPADLAVDLSRLAVGGASAGGGLAAGVALLARDRGRPDLSFQFLKYPCLDDRLETPSSAEITDPRLWNREQARRSWRDYLGQAEGAVSPYAVPARATNFEGLPPAYIYAAELDMLRDENIEYARRLRVAGVRVELRVAPGAFHGSDGLAPKAAISLRNQKEFVAVIRRALHPERPFRPEAVTSRARGPWL